MPLIELESGGYASAYKVTCYSQPHVLSGQIEVSYLEPYQNFISQTIIWDKKRYIQTSPKITIIKDDEVLRSIRYRLSRPTSLKPKNKHPLTTAFL